MNDVLIMQLKREVNELMKKTEASLLRHDGKIAELCKYLRDNLSSSLAMLLDTMIESGEINSIVTSVFTEVSKGNEYVNILNLGATRDTDITRFINSGLEEFHNIYIPEGTYIVSDSIVMGSYDKLRGAGKNTIIHFTGESFIKRKMGESVNFIQVEDLMVYNKSDKETTAIDLYTDNSSYATTDCDFRNIGFTDFNVGISTYYAWCNGFYNVRFNTTDQPLKLHAQSNNNNFFNCHFLSNEKAKACEFVNNDLTSFFGCEFANNIKAISRHSKLLFSGCYFENIGDVVNDSYNDLFLEVGTTNEPDQVNIIDFVGCHHTGNTLVNDKYLNLKLNSKLNGKITSDIMKIFVDGVNTLDIERPYVKGDIISFISAHSKQNQADTNTSNYIYEKGKFLIQNNSTNAYFRMKPISINKGDKIHVEISLKTPVECYLHFHSANETNPLTGSRQSFTFAGNNKLTKYSIDFEASENFSYCTLHEFAKDKAYLDYIVISKMSDVADTVNMIKNSPYYMVSKPTISPDRVMSVFSSNSNEVWTYNGTSWL